jgi:hypothetical protein
MFSKYLIFYGAFVRMLDITGDFSGKAENYARQSRHAKSRCRCVSMIPWPDCCKQRLLGDTTSPPGVGVGNSGVESLEGGGSPSEQKSSTNLMYDKLPNGEVRLKKGYSANRAGVTKLCQIARYEAERATPEALFVLLTIMRKESTPDKLKKECAIEILDRGGVYRHSQPKSSGDDHDKVIEATFSEEEIEAVLAEEPEDKTQQE